jgi:hypothetical protein
MSEELPAHLSDALAEWIVGEAEAETSALLDGLGPIELQFLAGALIAKAEERPKGDQQLRRHLRAAARLLDRAIAADTRR